MTIALASLAGIAALLAVGLAIYSASLGKKLREYSEIADVESYQRECEGLAQAAIEEKTQADTERVQVTESISELKKEVTRYQKAVRDFRTGAELKQYVKEMQAYAEGCKTLADLHAKAEHQQALVAQLTQDAEHLGYQVGQAKGAGDISRQIAEHQVKLTELRREIVAIEEVKELQEYGYYRRRYDYGSSEEYKQRLDSVRDTQKAMIKAKTAAVCDTEWTVQGSAAKGRKMVNDQIKLLLRAFNGESDAATAKVTHSNATSLETRIERSFDQINRMGEVNQVRLTREYLKQKLAELYLTHEHRVQKEEEKEEQRRIKEQMKEEAKVAKEIDKAQKEAVKEEESKRAALERARAELAAEQGLQTAKLAGLVEKLELELQEALDRKAKAIARAQLTRSGHVYVLSNIGSFGEGVYKIGMTRRLEPLERVKELGSASVPFLFDVHAMIYSEDAPALEARLHKHFDDRRVNFVNMRKEFFRVSMDEIREAVAENFGAVTFVLEPEADEYRQTVARLAEDTSPARMTPQHELSAG